MDQPLTDPAQQLKTQVDALVQLQGLDDDILARRRRIEELNRQIEQGNAGVAELETHLSAHKAEIERLVKDRRAAEVSAKEKQDHVRKLGGQLYEVKTNEAYNTMQAEIAQKKQETGSLEERILEMMVGEDEAQARLKALEQDLANARLQAAREQDGLRHEIADLEKEITGLQAQWDEAAPRVRPDYLDLYQRLRDAKGGKALAHIENNVCSGCRLAIRPQATIELKKYRALLFCDNCARILHTE